MSEPKLRAAGYIRVSSAGQIENESLSTQHSKIKTYCEGNGYKLTEIYPDKGISGGTVKERTALLQALRDGRQGKFDILIVNDLSRFGRNARELLNNHEELERNGIQLRSVKEGINFGTAYGKAMLTMLAAIAELELTMIKERMLENRIAKALQGIPTTGSLPFGRTYDKEKNEWGIDETKKKAIEWVAEQYLANESLQELAQQIEPRFGFSIHYQNLVKILKEKCGTVWEVYFEELGKPIPYDIPRLLSDSKIKAVRERLAHNRTNNRTDTKDYLLTGFLRCMHCGKTLIGQTQHAKYEYYVHQRMKSETCPVFTTVPLKEVEDTVFEMIFDDIGDMASFEKAISQSLPDTEYIYHLDEQIKDTKKTLTGIQKTLEKLIDLALEETLDKQTIREREQRLILAKEKATEELEQLEAKRHNLPDVDEVKAQAHKIRKDLLEKYESLERLNEMTFDEKKQLLHFLFDGKAPEGKGYGKYDNYGIYIDKKGKGKDAQIGYYMFARLRAFRHKDDDGSGGKEGRTRLFDVGDKNTSAHKNYSYKTINFATRQNEQGTLPICV